MPTYLFLKSEKFHYSENIDNESATNENQTGNHQIERERERERESNFLRVLVQQKWIS